MLKRILRMLALVLLVLALIYVLGPSPEAGQYNDPLPTAPTNLNELQAQITAQEARLHLKPDNEARIVWANDSLRQKTPYAIVYLHGFSASQEEGDPVHLTLAKNFGCNLYLSRLAGHGIDTTEQLADMTATNVYQSALQALAIGQQLGQKVILMGTSTGGTLALMLAARHPQAVQGLMLLSPNIAINNPSAWLLNNPWGLQIARLVQKGNYMRSSDTRPIYQQYWNTPYRIEAIVQLQEMLENDMQPETFARITQPLMMAYYYADDQHQDNVVRVDAMLRMFQAIKTPDAQKVNVPIPKAGDHVIGSYIKSGDYQQVIQAGRSFMQQVLQLPQVNTDTVVTTRYSKP